MLRSRLVRLATFAFGFALLWLFLSPRPAAADSIITVNFTGTTGTCFSQPGGHGTPQCSSIPANTTVTGTYSFDETTRSIVGPWSFSTFFGSFSGTGGDVEPPSQFNDNGYTLFFAGGLNLTVALTFSSPNGYGTLVLGPASAVGDFANEEIEFGYTTLGFVSGEASPVASTPEPASLLLLGSGLLAFAPVIRRHFRHARG